MKQSIKRKSIRGIMLGLLIILVGAKSCIVKAQSANSRTYYGYGLSLSIPQQEISSNIPQLNGLKVTFVGCNVGGMIANTIGQLKVNMGMYYSGSSSPYEIDMIRGGVTGNIYLLRLNKIKVAHLFEPYAVLGVSRQTSKFYGNYLSNDPTNSTSSPDQPFLGKVNSMRLNVGAGVEMQLESDHQKFVHMFAEVTYGSPLGSSASNSAFSQTKVMNAVTFNFGVNFGIVKISRYKR